MLKILDVTFPFFALVLVGWFATRRRWLPLEAIPGLNLFVLCFALPCMLLRFAAATPITRMFDAAVIGTWLACALVMVMLAIWLARRRGPDGSPRIGWDDAAFGALVAAFPNSGFMGVPLLVDLLGQRAAAPAIVSMSVDMIVTTSLCIALSRLGVAGSHGAGEAAMKALKGVLVNPLPWAIGAGCLVSASGGELPHLLMKPVSMLADAASPAALFTLGAVLARSQARAEAADAVEHEARLAGHPRGDVPLVVALKLLVHPLLVWLACHAALALGLPLDADAVLVLTLLAALPSASNVPMLAERYAADAGRIARIVLVTTALAFLSFTGLVAVMVG
ncbi:AEC family transporter [Leptothrix sp. BB-4]